MSLGGLLLGLVMPSLAATEFVVTTGDDAGPGTLREGILHLNSTGGGTIRFSNVATVTLQGELPEIQANMVIEADGTNRVVVDGNQQGRVFSIGGERKTVMQGLRITGGAVVIPFGIFDEGQGGGILNLGDLTLINCSVEGNSVRTSHNTPSSGGGVYNAGSLSLISCTILSNNVQGGSSAQSEVLGGLGRGGGVYTKGSVVASNSTIAGNWAAGGAGLRSPSGDSNGGLAGRGLGGGVYSDGGVLHAFASTFAFNAAIGGRGYGGDGPGYGGGVAGANLEFANCTFSQNSARGGIGFGGQINADGVAELKATTVVYGEATFGAGIVAPSIRIQNSIIAQNGPGATGDVSGVVISLGYNLIEGLKSAPTPTDIVGLDPILGPLQNNGGFTQTHLPLGGSPAVDAGISGGLLTDQRGFPRIKDNLTFTNALGGDGTDIGAVELEDAVRPSRTTNYVVNLNASGPGSLSQAILDANSAGGGAIHFSNVVGTIYLSGRLPTLTPGIEIRGPGRDLIAIDGDFKPIFLGAAKLVSRLSIQRGLPAFEGNFRIVDCAIVNSRPAVRTFGEVELLSSTVSDSVGFNGAFRANGKAIIRNCVFTNNQLITVCPGTIGSGDRSGGGAIIVESGQVSVTDTVFAGNQAEGASESFNLGCDLFGNPAYGGAISVLNGAVELNGCSFLRNSAHGGTTGWHAPGGATAGGGALYIPAGVLRATNCTFMANGATGSDGTPSESGGNFIPTEGGDGVGGAVFVGGGDASFVNCTFAGNLARGGKGSRLVRGGPDPSRGGFSYGGAVAITKGVLGMSNCTVVNNRAEGGAYNAVYRSPVGEGIAGGVYFLGTNTIRNSIFFGNTGTSRLTPSNAVVVASDAFGQLASRGYNLFGVTNGLIGFFSTDLLNVDPLLGPLRDNGGTVLTHALLSGSPAIDAGRGGGLTVDARGQPRTIDDPAVPNDPNGDGTDIGAFEVNHILTGTEATRKGNDILVRFTTVSDKTYGVEYRPEVGEGAWTELPGNVTGTGGIVTYRDVNAASLPRRFYRFFERAR